MGGQISVPDTVSMEGKVVVITGANTGLGFETAKNIAKYFKLHPTF
jgi:short-subunit dehydrogenase